MRFKLEVMKSYPCAVKTTPTSFKVHPLLFDNIDSAGFFFLKENKNGHFYFSFPFFFKM